MPKRSGWTCHRGPFPQRTMLTSENNLYGTPWTRPELVLALYLYCQIPFAQTKATSPAVVRLAQLLGRTPSSVARKLGNFGAFDPLLAQKGISGLVHYSKTDKEVWHEFYERWDLLVEESRQLLAAKEAEFTKVVTTDPQSEPDVLPLLSIPTGPTDQPHVVITRLYQSFFRRAVLSSYQNRCCICELDLPPLLVASHIIPWSANHKTRTNPENGLCLCTLHDKAFDRGLIAVKPNHQIVVSSTLAKSRSQFVALALLSFEGKAITLPSRFAPQSEYLQWHISNIFK